MTRNTPNRIPRTRPTLLVLALVAAFGAAHAADEDKSKEVEGSVSVGAGAVFGGRGDRSLFDQYSGYPPGSTARGSLAADYYRRDGERGVATQFSASSLLNGNRELDFRWIRYGDWKFSAGYRELTRLNPFTANTGEIGAGTTTPQLNTLATPGLGGEMDFKTKRTGLGLGFTKVITSRWQVEVGLDSEKKEGSRLFGIGMACPTVVAPGCLGTTTTAVGSAVLMVPEPIDSTHTQANARVSFAGEKLSLSAGYYGSFYRNDNTSLNPGVPGSLYNPVERVLPLNTGLQAVLNNPVALWPDNQAHQLDVTGHYAFNRTTSTNFKLAYSEATQHQGFAGFATPPGVTDLGAKVATTLAQVGVSARPMPKLSLNANLRYEKRDDKTPIAAYGFGLNGTSLFSNLTYPLTTTKGKAEAAYQFTDAYRGLLGVWFNNLDRGTLTPTTLISGVTALRQKNDESGVRAEIRRRLTTSFSGAIGLESSKRTGSNWLRPNGAGGFTEVADPTSATAQTIFSTGIFPSNMADRRRDKVKFTGDWQPTEKLGLQVVAEVGRDRYDAPSIYGVHKSGMHQLSVDASYAINDNWNVTGFASYGKQTLDQAKAGGTFMAFDDKSTTIGVGTTGKVSSKIDIGGNLSFINDRSRFAQALDATTDLASAALLAATGGLPDITFRQTQLKLFGRYTIDKQSAVRLDFIHWRTSWNDWAWNYNGTPFVYSDGTTVGMKTGQSVSFLGVTYTRRFP